MLTIIIINIIANTQNCHNALFSLLVGVLQIFVQFLSVFQRCSKCEGEWCACLVSWVHLQEGPLVIVEGLHHFSEADTRVVVRVPAKRGRGACEEGWEEEQHMPHRFTNAQDGDTFTSKYAWSVTSPGHCDYCTIIKERTDIHDHGTHILGCWAVVTLQCSPTLDHDSIHLPGAPGWGRVAIATTIVEDTCNLKKTV